MMTVPVTIFNILFWHQLMFMIHGANSCLKLQTSNMIIVQLLFSCCFKVNLTWTFLESRQLIAIFEGFAAVQR